MTWEAGSGSEEACNDTPSDPQTEDPGVGLEISNLRPKRCKLLYSTLSTWNRQLEPHATVGVVTVSLSG